MQASIRPYVRGWVGAGAVAATLLLIAFPPSRLALDAVPHGPASAPLFLALVALGEATELRLSRGSSIKAFTLADAAIVPVLLLFPPGWALALVLAGIAAGQVVRGRPLLQLSFNIGQFAVAASVAAVLLNVLRGDASVLALRSIGSAAVAIAVFGVVNTVAVTGVISRLEGRPVGELLREEIRLSSLNLAGNGSLGILVVLVWVHEPHLLPLVLAPGFAVHLAYRGLLRSDQLLTEVRSQNIRLDRVIQGATDGIVLLDRAGTVEIWNPTMESLTGIGAREAVGRPLRQVLEVVHPDGAPADPLAPLERATPQDPVHTQELVLTHEDGGGHRVLTTHGFLFDERGEVIGDVVLLRDVTREREVEHLKDDFVARVTHELRTPLTPIRGFAESVIEHDERLDPQTRRTMLSRIVEQTDHMIRLVDDLLLVPQLSETPARHELEVLEPGKLLAAVERAASDLPDPAPDVEITGEVDLPAVLAEPRWVALILDKLLSNAAKYAPSGSPVEVHLRSEDDRAGVRLEVIDRGRGIPPDQLERIFERFHRTEQPLTMETGGLGVGLYVARRLARRMGGDLTVESRLGEGSVFTLVLSAVHHEAGQVRPWTTGTPTAAGRPDRAGRPRDRRNGSDPAP